MLIDCDRCAARPAACSECVVGVLLGTPDVPAGPGPVPSPGPAEPAEPGARLPDGFGPVERRALEVLADHGLIPRLRLVPGSSGDDVDAAPTHRPAQGRARDAG